jgi:membrane-bound lytic murein transglycosylase B
MGLARLSRAQKAITLVPLAALSIAWTASLAGAGFGSGSASADAGGTLPDGSKIPAAAIRAPASLSSPSKLAPGIHGNYTQAVSSASVNGIPAAALTAYERAQTVINAADPSCHLPWELVAAIGRIESDHGRTRGNVLTDQGIAKPGIFGPVLNGKHGTSQVTDTDAGQLDGDAKFDRAVGPMQFIPSTWAIVGVDADGDGQRNPQDINDAALATAVYLCSGPDDLSTKAGQRSSVFRYNHSKKYVDLVLAIMHAYMNGDYTSVPNGTTSTSTTFGPPPTTHTGGPTHHGHPHGHHHGHHGHHTQGPHPTQSPTTAPTQAPTTSPTTAPTSNPTSGPTSNPTNLPTLLPTSLPTLLPTSLPTSLPTLLPTSLPTLLTVAQAILQCTAEGLVDNPLVSNDPFDQCVYNLTH